MLTALHIQDFVLIDQLSLPLGKGLIALTGETGAGKSILLEALGLAAGARTVRSAVRRNAEKGVVTAAFEPDASHPVWRALEENAVAADDDQVILRRVQGADGKSRAFINDQPVSVGLLKTIGELLIEIHGQHDGVSFLSAATHRALLDEFGGCRREAVRVESAFAEWRAAQSALEERRNMRDQALREADYLRHVVRELSNLDPQSGEEEELALKRADMMASQKVMEDLSAASAAMSEDGLEGKLSAASHRLMRASAQMRSEPNPLADIIDRIDRALGEFIDARAAVEDAVERLGLDESELEKTEERLFAIRAAARKHGVAPDALPEFLASATQSLASLDEDTAQYGALEKKVATTHAAFLDGARKLSDTRRKAAKKLDDAVARELAPLKLGKAVFSTSIKTDEDAPVASGIDAVEFMVATNPGAPMGPLKTIASGGELSRFVLAMKAALAAKENRTVIIFDEVDAGVGGAVADAVGERLARLAMDAQVLVVTHSPQVAARAATHWRVEKTQTRSDTTTRVAALDDDERIEEIARMLSGAVVTDEARAAARRLLGAPEKPKRARKKSA
ncbi:MAG: DNA repair protein RecN [Parvularculaceae bacterium]|nr:DNA repair protein RecN [Parvularculaceae bacterium]